MNADDDREPMSEKEPGSKPASGGGDFDDRLTKLRSSLDEEKARTANRPKLADNSGYAQAIKLGSEFVAGVVVGFVIGYGIDYFLGTKPWGMIVFLLLGFAAGTLNVLRSTGSIAAAPIDQPRRRDGGGGET
jgi:ATP synthase protein I